ncbi:MAG: helix-turn-helix transcriptional regulator [Ruminococcaceae bacterium]|nr:helix-turn-helix transcriptional regulator [Oscillospiraceae bacterium]
MNNEWNNIVIKKIALAIYVANGAGRSIHTDRPYHGLVLNDADAVKDYIFSDGRVLKTCENELFYLPKGSTYRVKVIKGGGCYAINFDAELCDQPFAMIFRNVDAVRRAFKNAQKKWRSGSEERSLIAMRSLYEIILLAFEESNRAYIPDKKTALITPAIEKLNESFCDNSLSVASLACMCNVSEAYFRRIFAEKYGISPKEYIINMRIDYAKQLLESGQLSVSDTAKACGYFEESHFSREFSKRVGITPREYKK